ncbi:MAG: sulfatase-like hydrolase/transferase, partial [Flavicella sp.]
MMKFCKQWYLLLIVFLTVPIFLKAQIPSKPNIILVLLDDVSPDQFSCYGVDGAANTPNIDKLATDGVMFKTCYASAMCGPSRVEIMTGEYGTSTGVLHNSIWKNNSKNSVYSNHQAFGKLLKDAGYATAIAGKWHAGNQMPYESSVGFDEYCLWENLKEIAKLPGSPTFTGAMEDNKTPSRYWHPGIVKNDVLLDTQATDYAPDIFADFIMDFMERKTQEGTPFLAYWPSVAPHGTRLGYPSTPFRGTVGDLGPSIDAEDNVQRLKALNEYIDFLMGKIMQKINDLGIADNTIVIFTSDNGTAVTAKTRGVERGSHVVNIIAGAGIKKRGATDELTDFTDIAPTLVELAGASLPSGKKFDGESLVPFISGAKDTHRDWIYGYIATSQLVRTKEYMLEVVNPMLGMPKGRFYYTGTKRNQKGYEFVNDNAAHAQKRAEFDNILSNFPAMLANDAYWNTNQGARFFTSYTSESEKEKHLYNHKDYKFYDE